MEQKFILTSSQIAFKYWKSEVKKKKIALLGPSTGKKLDKKIINTIHVPKSVPFRFNKRIRLKISLWRAIFIIDITNHRFCWSSSKETQLCNLSLFTMLISYLFSLWMIGIVRVDTSVIKITCPTPIASRYFTKVETILLRNMIFYGRNIYDNWRVVKCSAQIVSWYCSR